MPYVRTKGVLKRTSFLFKTAKKNGLFRITQRRAFEPLYMAPNALIVFKAVKKAWISEYS